MDRLNPALPDSAMQGNVFDHDDRVVNYQAHRRRQPAQRHQVEALVQGLQCDESDKHRDRNDHSRDRRGPPVAQEQDHDDRGQYQADQDGIAHALDGCGHDLRLIVEGVNMDSRRQRLPYAVDLGVNFVGNRYRIAVGLAVDVEQHRWLSVGGHDGVHGLYAGRNSGHIAHPDRNSGWCGLDYDL